MQVVSILYNIYIIQVYLPRFLCSRAYIYTSVDIFYKSVLDEQQFVYIYMNTLHILYIYIYQDATALRDLLDGIIGAVRHHHKQMAGSRVDAATHYIIYTARYVYIIYVEYVGPNLARTRAAHTKATHTIVCAGILTWRNVDRTQNSGNTFKSFLFFPPMCFPSVR